MGILTERSRPLLKFSLGDNHNMAVRLILINLIVFAALLFVKVVYLLTGQPDNLFAANVIPWAVLSANPSFVLTHPWTIITYMFVHIGFWHLLSSVIWLWWFGELLQGLVGYEHVVPVYLYGGFAGALTFVLAYALIPGLHQMEGVATSVNVGAAASVMALIICLTVVAPNYKVFPMLGGGIPLFVITIAYVGLSLLGQQGGSPYGYIAAQAGGAIMGVFFGWRLKEGYHPGRGLNRFLYRLGHVWEPGDVRIKSLQPKKRKYRKKASSKKETPYKRIGPVSEHKVDDILDKINQSGYQSLTAEEKDILLRASRQDER